jgi:hypothetical protein
MRPGKWTILLFFALALPCPALPCTLCYNVRLAPTFRREANHPGARLILQGTLCNARLAGDRPGAGTTDLRIEGVLKCDPTLPAGAARKVGDVIQLTSYLPGGEPGQSERYLVFCDFHRGKLDPYRGLSLSSAATGEYIRSALALDPRDSSAALLFFFRHLDHPDSEVANDAFLEMARATDQQIGSVANRLSAPKLREWLGRATTADDRLGLYSFLLGACGGKEDLSWFRERLDRPDRRWEQAYDGLLSGLIQLNPEEGWKRTIELLRDAQKPLPLRLAAMRVLRFHQGWKPRESQAQIVKGLEAALSQGDLVDLAAEDLRNWRIWDLTDAVLAQYGRKGLDAPIQRRAILRYALSCPLAAAGRFVEAVRKREASLISEIEEGLRRERQ